MKRIHVKGNTWVLEGPQLVGLYQIDESTCLLLDPGSTKLQGEIEAALAQAGLTPVGARRSWRGSPATPISSAIRASAMVRWRNWPR